VRTRELIDGTACINPEIASQSDQRGIRERGDVGVEHVVDAIRSGSSVFFGM